jgi:hypothetical protein
MSQQALERWGLLTNCCQKVEWQKPLLQVFCHCLLKLQRLHSKLRAAVGWQKPTVLHTRNHGCLHET